VASSIGVSIDLRSAQFIRLQASSYRKLSVHHTALNVEGSSSYLSIGKFKLCMRIIIFPPLWEPPASFMNSKEVTLLLNSQSWIVRQH
jgi:hypothetical protein